MMLLLSVLAVSAAGTDQCAVVDARNTTETLHAVQSRARAAVSSLTASQQSLAEDAVPADALPVEGQGLAPSAAAELDQLTAELGEAQATEEEAVEQEVQEHRGQGRGAGGSRHC